MQMTKMMTFLGSTVQKMLKMMMVLVQRMVKALRQERMKAFSA